MRRAVLLVVLFCALVSAQLGDLSGTYTSNYCGLRQSCTLSDPEFVVCHDVSSGVLQGLYSRFGYIYGNVDDTGAFNGTWFEAGIAGPFLTDDPPNYYDNYGPIELVFTSENGQISASGSAHYNNPVALHFEFQFNKTSDTSSPESCWAGQGVGSANSSLNSAWTILLQNADWPICVTGGNYSVGSYSFGANERGVTVGPCYLGATICAFDFVVEDSDTSYAVGIGLARRGGTDMYSVLWSFNDFETLDDLSTADWSFEDSDIVSTSNTWQVDANDNVNAGSPFPPGCSTNYFLFGASQSIQASFLLVACLATVLLFIGLNAM